MSRQAPLLERMLHAVKSAPAYVFTPSVVVRQLILDQIEDKKD